MNKQNFAPHAQLTVPRYESSVSLFTAHHVDKAHPAEPPGLGTAAEVERKKPGDRRAEGLGTVFVCAHMGGERELGEWDCVMVDLYKEGLTSGQ